MNFENLTPEQLEKAKACNSVDELVVLANSEGVELTDEELDDISGGSFWINEYYCPMCGSHNVAVWQNSNSGHCYDCDYRGPFHQFSH